MTIEEIKNSKIEEVIIYFESTAYALDKKLEFKITLDEFIDDFMGLDFYEDGLFDIDLDETQLRIDSEDLELDKDLETIILMDKEGKFVAVYKTELFFDFNGFEEKCVYELNILTNYLEDSNDVSWENDSENENIWSKKYYMYGNQFEASQEGLFLNENDIEKLKTLNYEQYNPSVEEIWRYEDFINIDNYLTKTDCCFENGQRKIDGQYENFEKTRVWKKYDKNGNIIEEVEYENGELVENEQL